MAIQIIGNVGNQGYALPMVSAYPVDVNLQYLLAWNPVQQALDYVPYLGNALGDFTVTRDLAVVRNATVGGTLAVTGAATFSSTVGATNFTATVGTDNTSMTPTGFQFLGTKVVGARDTGWGAPTGTATKTTFVTAAVTLPELGERVKALIDALTTHGMIGA